MNFFKCLSSVLCAAAIIFVAACAPRNSELSVHRDVTSPGLVTKAAQPQEFLTLNSLLLVPLVIGEKAQGAESATMNSSLEEAVSRDLGLDIIKLRERQPKVSAKNQGEALSLARQLGADGVIFASINNFKERVGSRLGVTEPASLDFSIVVLRVRDNKEIWSGNYSYQDKALSDNLLTIGDTFKNPGWKSAQDLFSMGLHEALSDFSERRVGQFAVPLKQG